MAIAASDNSFTFNGKSSLEMGLYIEKVPSRTSAEKDLETIVVAGRSEPLHVWNGRWKPYTQEYRCWFKGDPTEEQLHAINEWLHSAPPGSRLTDSYDTKVFHTATYKGGVSVDMLRSMVGKFPIKFEQGAQAFLRTGEVEQIFSQIRAGNITNDTPFVSKPLIRVRGSVSGLVQIGNATLTILFEGYSDEREIWIDCEAQEAWEVGPDGTEISRNAWISRNEFPSIQPGTQEVILTGGITSASIWSRTFTL